jgi:mono/diheme cytochrome c family protein
VTVNGKGYNNVMAPLGATLSDAQIAAVLTFVRQSWGNDAAPIDTATVTKIRAQHADRTQFWTAAELGR